MMENKTPKEKIINRAKEKVAKKYGFEKNIISKDRWTYAMLITHRRKKQIEMYEEVLKEILEELNE